MSGILTFECSCTVDTNVSFMRHLADACSVIVVRQGTQCREGVRLNRHIQLEQVHDSCLPIFTNAMTFPQTATGKQVFPGHLRSW